MKPAKVTTLYSYLYKPKIFMYTFLIMQLIPNSTNTKTITDLREDALGVLNALEKDKLIYVNYKSKPRAVVLDVDQFIQLMEELEDLRDQVDAKLLAQESRGKGVPLDEVKRKYC